MAEPTLFVDGMLVAANAVVFAYVARALWTRNVPAEVLRPNRLFAAWWAALAGVLVLAALVRAAAGAGILTLPLYLTTVDASLFALCVGMAGLLYYVLFLVTGRDLLRPLAAFYGILFVALFYYFTASSPDSLAIGPWEVKAHYSQPPTGAPLLAALALLVAPPIAGAIGYFTLVLRVSDPAHRYRIALVSGSIFTWTASGLLATELELTHDAVWSIAGRLIGLVAALAILMAYRPPAWVRRRWAPTAA